ncbi:DMT family transporter [Candidatus Gottesmanbacteria bacterium]|nr:DMT family transporter [Candidatus Gottesmanbacteria bacterium]
MLIAYFIAIIAGILSGITESLNKNITEEKYSAFSYSFLQIALNLVLITIPFILFSSLPPIGIVYLYILIAELFVLIGNASLIKAYKTEDLSNVIILFQISLILPFVLGVTLLQEKITSLNIIGILLIISGIIIIFYRGKKLKPTTGFFLALLSGTCFGFGTYFIKLASSYTNPLALIFIAEVILTVLLLLIPQTYKDIKTIFRKYSKKIIISRFTALGTFYLLMWAFQRSKLSISNTNFNTAFILSSVFLGVFFLGEKTDIRKKLTGSALCTLGIILLNFF